MLNSGSKGVTMKRLSLATVLFLLVSTAAFAQDFVPTVTSEDQLSLTGTGSSMGMDFDGNGLYDFLMITVGVNCQNASYYNYSVKLTDKNGTVLASQNSLVHINAGVTSFNLFFDGAAIGADGVNGPYYLTDLTLQNLFGEGSLDAPLAFATDAFKANEFEGFTGTVDTTPPTISVTATPAVLWPVDHKMHEIKLDVFATDDVDENPVVALLSITSNQGENLTGDGNTSPDIVVKDGHIYLRAERNGTMKSDRVYAVTYTATDAAGNVGSGFAKVTVPHDHN
jgi:hypothetical protein